MSAVAAGVRGRLSEQARQFPVGAFFTTGILATALGAAVFLWALTTGQAPRAWQAYHVNFMFWIGLAQGLVVFAATQKLAKGHWSGLLIRFAESAVAFLVVALVLYGGLIVGRTYIFSWLHEPRLDIGAWLVSGLFFPRNGLILAALAWLSWRFVRHDVAPDVRELADGRPVDRLEGRDQIAREAAILVVGFAFGHSLLAFDLMMSLAHKWVSNLFGAFYFMGSFLAALMALAFLAFALVSLAGIWLERYLEIVPSINGGAAPALGVPEIGVTLLFGGLFLLSMAWFARRYPMISPRLAADTLEREAH